MTSRRIARGVVAALLALAVFALLIVVFQGYMAPRTSELNDVVVPLEALGAAAVFIIALQRLPR